jgi:hypothetical protein
MFPRRREGDPQPSAVRVLRQLSISARAVIPRPRAEVWAEIALGEHPAWTDSGVRHRRVAGTPHFDVGTAYVAVSAPAPPFGLRAVVLHEITDVSPTRSVTTEIVTSGFRHTETLSLEDANDAATLAKVQGWLEFPAPQQADLGPQRQRFVQLAEDFLRRAAEWSPQES